MDGPWGEGPEVVGGLQAVVPEAAGASLEPLLGNTPLQNEGAEAGVGWASAWAAGACLVREAVQDGGDVVGVVNQGASGAWGPLAGGPEDQGPCEVVKQGASVGPGVGE